MADFADVALCFGFVSHDSANKYHGLLVHCLELLQLLLLHLMQCLELLHLLQMGVLLQLLHLLWLELLR
jgi:hypothetical protein